MKKLINNILLTEEEAIIEHDAFAKGICARYLEMGAYNGFEYDDIYSMSRIGLVRAYRAYEPERNLRFSTYAYHYVRGEIMNTVNESGTLIKYSSYAKSIARKIELSEQTNWSTQKLMKHYDVRERTIQSALHFLHFNRASSLNEPLEDGDGSLELMDTVGEEDDESTMHIAWFLNQLDERERRVLELVADGYTQEAAGKVQGISKALANQAMRRVREKYVSHELEHML